MNQQLTITINYKVEHTPANPQHLHQIAKNYLKGKGITLLDDGSIYL